MVVAKIFVSLQQLRTTNQKQITVTTISKNFTDDKKAIKFLNSLYSKYKFVTVIQAPINGGEYKFNVGN